LALQLLRDGRWDCDDDRLDGDSHTHHNGKQKQVAYDGRGHALGEQHRNSLSILLHEASVVGWKHHASSHTTNEFFTVGLKSVFQHFPLLARIQIQNNCEKCALPTGRERHPFANSMRKHYLVVLVLPLLRRPYHLSTCSVLVQSYLVNRQESPATHIGSDD